MRIAVFIDYWNFQLAMNRALKNDRSKIDWKNVGQFLAVEACAVLSVNPAALSYEGTYVYTSYNPKTEEGKRFKNWATTWLDRQPGLNVQARERRPKDLPRCTTCHRDITHCPHAGCGQAIAGTVEKGVDTLLVTDLIRLGMQEAYDAAVLVSSDADLIPGVDFVQTSAGRKVIQAGFPPGGVDLATQCWGSFDVKKIAGKLVRE